MRVRLPKDHVTDSSVRLMCAKEFLIHSGGLKITRSRLTSPREWSMLHCNNLCGAQPRLEKDSSPKKGPAFATFCYKETLPWIESTKRGTEGATSTMFNRGLTWSSA